MFAIFRHFQIGFLIWNFLYFNSIWQISMEFVSKATINYNPALIQIIAWCWTGDKPLSEPNDDLA